MAHTITLVPRKSWHESPYVTICERNRKRYWRVVVDASGQYGSDMVVESLIAPYERRVYTMRESVDVNTYRATLMEAM